MWWVTDNMDFETWCCKYLKNIIDNSPITLSKEVCYNVGNLPIGDTLLLLCGGPSVNEYNWHWAEYHQTWSMNHFFKNSKIKKTPLSLIALSPEVDLEDTEFLKYMLINQPLVMFEWNQNWVTTRYDELQKFNHDFFGRCGVFQTRFYSKLGMGVRLIILACELGFKKIDFVGMDGANVMIQGCHGFQPGKKTLPSGVEPKNANAIFMKQYDFFWNYIQDKYPNVEIVNRGRGCEYHRNLKRCKSTYK